MRPIEISRHWSIYGGTTMTEEQEDTLVAYEIMSRISPPPANCPSCDSLLPSNLGELDCVVCSAKVRVEHEPTRHDWLNEKVTCPACRHVLVAGTDVRPADLRCASCRHEFTLSPKVIKVEIKCPACERGLRITQRPGERNLKCPACQEGFRVTF